jgi:hypothetical protein
MELGVPKLFYRVRDASAGAFVPLWLKFQKYLEIFFLV